MRGPLDKFLCQMKNFNHCLLAATLIKAIAKDAGASDFIGEGSRPSRTSTHPGQNTEGYPFFYRP